jgi:polygalacturonase
MFRPCRAAALGLAPLALALTMGTAAAQSRPDPCNPLSYGAVGDGTTDNTAAIQSAIDGCAKGGGTVRLPAIDGHGVYLTGPITLATHVRLLLDKDVTLLATTDHARYKTAFLNHPYDPHEALVSAYQADDTGIIGPGTIDGQGGKPASDGGPSWWAATHPTGATIDGAAWYAAPYADVPVSNGVPRPWLVEFYQCTNVTANDITLANAPAENLVIRYSDHITVSELRATVAADAPMPHADGVDLIGSSRATLLFLNIDTGGDAVALKSGLPLTVPVADASKTPDVPQLPTHDVQIANSTFAHGNGIMVVGEAVNGVYNVSARNIVGRDSEHGLLIKSSRARGSHATGINNIIAQNLTLTNVRRPFAITAYDPAAGDAAGPHSDAARPITALTPNIHDITISQLTASGASLASSVEGLPEACIRNVKLEAVKIASSGAGIELQNTTGTFTNVTGTSSSGAPPFVIRANVTVAAAGTTPPLANSLPPNSPCGGDPAD